MTSTVYIAKNVYGGDGLGRLGDGRVVFVPGAWVGENVKAEIVEEKRHFVKARLVEVVEASPERIDGGELNRIPGCVYANLSANGEAEAKQAQLAEFLDRARLQVGENFSFLGNDGFSFEDAPETARLNYRNKVVYHFARQGGKWAIGYRIEPSHEIVEIENDPLAVKAINDKLPEIRKAVLTLLTTGAPTVRRDIEQKGNVTIRWTAKTGVKWWIGDAPKGTILKETTSARDFEVPSDGFYQVNPQVGERLVSSVVASYLKGIEAAPNILDLYCGVGVFGLCCLGANPNPKEARLTGIESGRQAIEFAQRNALAQKLEGRFFAEQVGRNLNKIKIGSRTTVIIDPPRDGLEPKVPQFLAASKAPRIFYVSCDPATLVRDLKALSRSYAIESVRGFNMFPRTARFETFVALKKR